jgi:molecular chaperone DnaJ
MQSGFFAALVTCRACGGEGVTIKNPCRACGGGGTARRPRTIGVTVPPGVDTGVTMRLPGQGDAGERGGAAGHLYVNIAVEPDPFFTRDGADIHVTVPVTLAQAVLGCALTVPTIRGEVELKIPPGSQPSDKLLMRGRGVRRLDGGTSGSQYVHLRVDVPRALSARQRELMAEYAKLEGAGAGEGGAGGGKKGFLQETIERIKKALATKEGGGDKAA